MADIISDLASKSGISPDLAKKGLGTVLSFFKEKVPAEAFSRIAAAVPGADGMMAAAQAVPEQSGGIIGAITGAASKLFGGSGAAIVTKLTQSGFSADQLTTFLPNVLEFLKSKLPADVMKQISGLLPAAEGAAK
jgi:hypothetical protein